MTQAMQAMWGQRADTIVQVVGFPILTSQEAHQKHGEQLNAQGVFNEFMPLVEGDIDSMDYQIDSV